MARNRLIAVGAFVVLGVLLFGVGLFFIGSRRMLWSDTFEAYAEFSKVSGLENGAKVRVSGMDAGEVEEIHVPAGPAGRFRLKMRVREDLHPLLRLDSVASIQNDGLVGNKFLQVEAGSEQSPLLPDGGTMQSREPFDLADMLDKMSDTIDLATRTINEVKVRIDVALASVTDRAGQAQELFDDVGQNVRSILASTDKIAKDLTAVTSDVRNGRGTVGKLMNDDALYVSAKNIAADAQKAVASLREVAEDARGAVQDFRGEKGPMQGVTGDLRQTLASAKDAMADLAENTEALKRSFFFRGFFNKRGYFDLQDVSVQQYREGALETKDRRVLRIWASSAVLFEKDASGVEQLTDAGRARLDSAMAALVKYPKTSPLVVEGYAQDTTGDLRFLLSRRRAELVSAYLVGRFGLDPNTVATMPMGAEAAGSPSGDRWDGVALALFVSRSAV
jgi:phospholipid/cholesterol/gamma-HCH transport system substrate-binding protein